MTFTPNWTEVHPHHKWDILWRQKRFLLFALYTSFGSLMLGFDFSVASTSFAFSTFAKQFGKPSAEGYSIPASLKSGMIGASAGGEFVGVMLAAYLLDKTGRKPLIGLGSIISAAGVAMQMPAQGWGLFVAGRFINAIGFGAVFVQSPVWIGENVRPELRGFFLCVTNASIVLGQFILACAAQGSSYFNDSWQWQMLVVLQFIPVAILLAGYAFFPESPYYLMSKGKTEAARASLLRIHGPEDNALIEAEVGRIANVVAQDQQMRSVTMESGSGYLQCIRGTNLKRTVIACLAPAGQQLIGSAFVLGYVTYFLSLIGVKDYFTISLGLYILMLLSNLSAFFFIESTGRRALLVPGIATLTIVLFIMGCMGLTKSPAAVWVVLVCIFLWALVYQCAIGAIGFAFAAEVGALPLRPYTQAYIAISQDAFGFVVSYTVPYMISTDAGNLGAKVGFIFAGLGLLATACFYFIIPETKGLDYDEIDYLFRNKVSCRHFQSAVQQYRRENGRVQFTKQVTGVAEGVEARDEEAGGKYDAPQVMHQE